MGFAVRFMVNLKCEAIYTSTCPKCLRPGYYKVKVISGKPYLYVYHGHRSNQCYICSLDELPRKYPDIYSAIVKLTTK